MLFIENEVVTPLSLPHLCISKKETVTFYLTNKKQDPFIQQKQADITNSLMIKHPFT